jgi:hypothetical protein
MDTMILDINGGDAMFRCAACGREFPVDASEPFVPQLRHLSIEHRCLLHSVGDELQQPASPNGEFPPHSSPFEVVRLRSAESPNGAAPHDSSGGTGLDRWVIPWGKGWAVTQHDPQLVSGSFELQVEAIIHAEQEIADAGGGGDLVILGHDGEVRERTLVRARRRSVY